ncbi:MAG TPA: hypothetical protein VF519_03695 [Mycobacteriales bacterium]|jgi:hypothetical protein
MWEYRWAEVPAGSGEDPELTRLGADGWEAVGMTVTGEHFGKTWVRVLFKRAVTVAAAPGVIDLTAAERVG